ncbi:MAG TPA: hypothetical protein VMS17_04470 [Gemmataceae bacterium]|nr:hypothetical protein [Gemmataceae bacterium]
MLLHAALDVFTWLLDEPWSTAGRAYDLYFREDFSIADSEASPTLAGAFVQALRQGEPVLAALVTREVASRLGRCEPGPALAAHVSRRLGFFKLLAFEAYQVMLEMGRSGSVAGAAMST